jgi:prepilin-type N-terminal cleavage/methylation domain-containing protein
LVELLITLAVIGIISSFAFVTGASVIKDLKDPRGDFHLRGEAKLAAEWLESMIQRSLTYRSDCTIFVSNVKPVQNITTTWKTGGKKETWTSNGVAFMGSGDSYNFTYSHAFQTLTPAVTISIYAWDDKKNRFTITDWRITVSAYGHVKAYRKS